MRATPFILIAIFALVPTVQGQTEANSSDALQPVSTRAGVFTAAQSERGEGLFEVACGECHQPADFQEGFLEGWEGQTADELFKDLRATMPEDSPGSLRSSEYAAVIAYLFALNGLEAGEERLPSSARRLKQILIEAPEKG